MNFVAGIRASAKANVIDPSYANMMENGVGRRCTTSQDGERSCGRATGVSVLRKGAADGASEGAPREWLGGDDDQRDTPGLVPSLKLDCPCQPLDTMKYRRAKSDDEIASLDRMNEMALKHLYAAPRAAQKASAAPRASATRS